MRADIEERTIHAAEYMVKHKCTVRELAVFVSISKSTVHKDLVERLPIIDPALYRKVRKVLDRNKAERHIRGGISTRNKYRGLKK